MKLVDQLKAEREALRAQLGRVEKAIGVLTDTDPTPVTGRRGRPAHRLRQALEFMVGRDNRPTFLCELTGGLGRDAANTVRTCLTQAWNKYFEPAGPKAAAPSGHTATPYRLTEAGLKRARDFGLGVAAQPEGRST